MSRLSEGVRKVKLGLTGRCSHDYEFVEQVSDEGAVQALASRRGIVMSPDALSRAALKLPSAYHVEVRVCVWCGKVVYYASCKYTQDHDIASKVDNLITAEQLKPKRKLVAMKFLEAHRKGK